MIFTRRVFPFLFILLTFLSIAAPQQLLADIPPAPPAEDADQAAKSAAKGDEKGFDDTVDGLMKPIAEWADWFVFYSIPVGNGQKAPIVLILLAGTAIFLTLFFKFINIRGFMTAIRTTRSKYTPKDAPGDISHFQALSTALSATVGLGNIAGVAIAIGIGGPGATFWMILLGLFGMTTKFAECTLGVKYREFDKDGRVKGGAMYYLSKGLKERGMGGLGSVLAVLFAIFVIGGAFGAGNMYQSNQSSDQFLSSWAPEGTPGWAYGSVLAVLVGMVILGGIVWIARVTSFLVPFMCLLYMGAASFIIFTNLDKVGPAISTILNGAFGGEAILGGIIGVLIQGVKRAAFSNEAGLGSAPIAHAAVKTNKPASEGYVALLEPFVDTVVVCTMTALVVVIAGTWKVGGSAKADMAILSAPESTVEIQSIEKGQFLRFRDSKEVEKGEEKEKWHEVISLISADHKEETKLETVGWVAKDAVKDVTGIPVTSMAFEKVFSWFPKVLSIAVFLFAFSTMISWSYYGQQGVMYLFKGLKDEHVKIPVFIYKIVFCLLIIVGASASLDSVLKLSDAMVFAMVIPNLIGLYILLPVVRSEAKDYNEHVKKINEEG
ncbi:MAG: AGCS family alanine or glycine:cation symporter [Verrucomicrobiales bacterium]|jgi:AGCS family alanine or glycine:cation symporter